MTLSREDLSRPISKQRSLTQKLFKEDTPLFSAEDSNSDKGERFPSEEKVGKEKAKLMSNLGTSLKLSLKRSKTHRSNSLEREVLQEVMQEALEAKKALIEPVGRSLNNQY